MLTVSETAERLGAAVRELREAAGKTQADLIGLLGERGQSWLSRRENGETELTPSEIERIERVLGAEPGAVFRVAGMCTGAGSVRAALDSDPLLDDQSRRILLHAYDAAVRGTRAVRRRKRGDSDVTSDS